MVGIMVTIDVKRAQPGTHPKGKPFYVQVDGQNVGENNEMHFSTVIEATQVANRYVENVYGN